MDYLKEKFEIIKEIDPDWLNQIRNVLESDNEYENKKLIEAFNRLFEALRNACKQEKSDIKKLCVQYMDKKGEKWLLERVNNSLEPYFAFGFLRAWQIENIERCKIFIEYVFENVIIRFDPKCAPKYCNKEKVSTSEFIKAAKILDSLVDYYIKCHFTSRAIVDDLIHETDLEKSICEYISQKIDENYLTLQLKVTIDLKM